MAIQPHSYNLWRGNRIDFNEISVDEILERRCVLLYLIELLYSSRNHRVVTNLKQLYVLQPPIQFTTECACGTNEAHRL
jgi:hypothetical protein